MSRSARVSCRPQNSVPEPWTDTSSYQRLWTVTAGLALLVVAWFSWRSVRRRLGRSLEGGGAGDARRHIARPAGCSLDFGKKCSGGAIRVDLACQADGGTGG